MKTHATTSLNGLLLTMAANLLWGTVVVAIGIGLRFLNPYNLVFVRFVVASSAIVIASMMFKSLQIGSKIRKRSTWLLAAVYTLTIVLQFVGQSMTNASETALLTSLAPTIVPVAAFFVLKDRISTAQKGATLLGLIGLLLVTVPTFGPVQGHLPGDMVLFATSLSLALFVVLSKRWNAQTMDDTFAIILVVTFLLAPVAVLLGRFNPADLHVPLVGWASIVWLGVPCMSIALALWMKGLWSISASQSGTLIFIQLVMGLALAVLLLGEPLTLPIEVGAASIVSAIIISARAGE